MYYLRNPCRHSPDARRAFYSQHRGGRPSHSIDWSFFARDEGVLAHGACEAYNRLPATLLFHDDVRKHCLSEAALEQQVFSGDGPIYRKREQYTILYRKQ